MAKPLETWSLDREAVVVKVLNYQRDKVLAAWLNPEALADWYGPASLRIDTHEADIREGGVWRFDMVGMFEGRGQRFANLMHFVRIVPNERVVMNYGTPDPDDRYQFVMTVTFDEQADGKTVLTLQQLHPSRERRQTTIDFGAVEYGLQTLDGLRAWLDVDQSAHAA